MARRDRRRGGAHSAPRKGTTQPASPSEPTGPSGSEAPPTDAEARPGPPPPTPAGPPADGDTVDAPSTGVSGVPVAARSAPLGDQTGESFFGSSLPEAAAGPTAADLLSPDAGAPLSRKERRQARSASGPGGGGGPAGGEGNRRNGKPKRTWLDRVLLGGIVVVALALVAMGTGYAYVQFRFNQVAKVTVKHLKKAPVGQPFNVLLIGSDSRVGESSADVSHFGNQSNAGGQRSDVVKIVHIVPATGQVSVISIPRDTVITVAGDTSQIGKYNRINATYNTGPDQLVESIEDNFGIPIEHVVQVDFAGLRGAVDAIGGIKLDFPYPAKDAYTGLDVTQMGCQLVNGGYSLALARSRHYEYYKNGYWQYDGTSDFGRIQRQNAFLKAVINQAETKYNPLTLNAFVGSVVQGVTVDSTFSVSDLISLARQFHNFSSSALATATLPTYSSNSSEFGYLGSVLYVQEPQAQQVISQFLGQAPDTAVSAPPGPYGAVSSTTTTSTVPRYASPGGSTPSTSTSSSTTTTIETDFDPTPC
jgi:LCP family protein required for cell wall assembly